MPGGGPGRPGGAAGALDHLRHADPVLARVIDAHPEFDPRAWLRELPPMDAFGALVFQIAGQQLSVASTRRILERVYAAYGGRNPSAVELLATEPAVLRAAGLSARKVETLRTVAEAFAEGTVSERGFREMSDEAIERELTALKGVGPWTVHGMLIIALDRPDVVLPGDLALRKAMQRVYALGALPTPEDVLRIAEPWRPYRSLATAYLFQAAFDEDVPPPGVATTPPDPDVAADRDEES